MRLRIGKIAGDLKYKTLLLVEEVGLDSVNILSQIPICR